MIGIIGAMKEEVTEILRYFNEYKEETIHGVEFYTTNHNGKDIVICQSGIGKVNSAVSTTIMLTKFNVQQIINIGSAGGVKGAIGDVVVAENTQYFDVDVTAFGYEYGQVPGMPLHYDADDRLVSLTKTVLDELNIPSHIGTIASSDSFITSMPTIPAIAYEMEASSIAQVAFKLGVPFVIIRALSDIINGGNHVDFNEFLVTASKKSAQVVIKLIEIM